jgi:hypothetical protein
LHFSNVIETLVLQQHTDAKAIAEELGITPTFKPKRVARRKTFFDCENVQQTNMSAEEKFRTDYFLRIVDQALQSMEARYKQY